jgi:2-C-methyl-D-erythritol 4-phosphate cytidylyltransferase
MAVALIVAAGRGERLGGKVPKAFVELAGRPLLRWSIDALAAVEGVARIVVALPAGEALTERALANTATEVIAVEGADARSGSVARALQAAGDGEIVLVHDAARPLVTPAIAASAIDALRADAHAVAAIAAARVTDTIKEGDGTTVARTLDRSRLWAIQTPQVFRREALERGLADDELLARATDDAWLIEQQGGVVRVLPAGEPNFKVTTADDLRLAELLLVDR